MKYYLFYFILIFAPISNLFHHFFPVSILGFSLWNTFLVLFIVHLFFFITSVKKVDYLNLFLFSYLFIIVSLLRKYLFQVSFSDSFSSFWYLYVLLVFLIIIKNIKLSKVVFSNILLIHILFLGSIGTLYFFNLPTIEIQSDFTSEFLSDDKHRFEGIWSGANVHSNFLVTFFLIFTLISKNKPIYILALSLLVFFSVLAAGSRLPLLLFLLHILYFVYIRFKFLILPVVLIFIFSILQTNVLDTNIRLINDGLIDFARIDKTILFFDLSISNIYQVMFFGVDPVLQVNEHVSISDNSFSLIILNSGLFIFFFWIFFIKRIYYNFFQRLYSNKLFFIFILLIFSLNNAILYLPWVIFVVVFIASPHWFEIENYE